jgi:hypothetical protein
MSWKDGLQGGIPARMLENRRMELRTRRVRRASAMLKRGYCGRLSMTCDRLRDRFAPKLRELYVQYSDVNSGFIHVDVLT